MRESIKNRIDAVRRGEVPEGYRTERAMLFPNSYPQENEPGCGGFTVGFL